MNIPTIIEGNTFALAIPLQVYAIEDDELVLHDYVPESGDNVTIGLKGARRNYSYTPTFSNNIAFVALGGNELCGIYAVEVSIVKDDGTKLTSFKGQQLKIVKSIDDLTATEIVDGVSQNVLYLDPEIFIAGKDGRGIVSIVKTATSGLVDTYTITYTDNTTSTFNVTNGKDGINGADGQDGADGVGIASIAKTGTSGLVDTYTITMTNGTTYTYQVTNGKDGEDGADGTDGVGIVSITKTSTAGLVDTYTILLTNGTTTTFTVTNGSDATQVQSDWSQSDSTAVDFIKNKPTIPTVPTNVSAFNNDAGYLTQHQSIKTVNNTSLIGNGNIDLVPTETFNNFCPIIEDTRSSAVATITGVAPFASLEDGQRIILHLAYVSVTYTSISLTLSNGTVESYDAYMQQGSNNLSIITNNLLRAGGFYEFIFDGTKWVLVGADTNTTFSNLTQSEIQAGTSTIGRVVPAKLLHDNAYIVEETYSSGSLKANKMYDFGTVSSALTIPSLDATNDLVSNALNFYALRFIAGADNLSITFPTGVIVDDTPTINTGDYVEIMINKYGSNFYASIKVWQAQQ